METTLTQTSTHPRACAYSYQSEGYDVSLQAISTVGYSFVLQGFSANFSLQKMFSTKGSISRFGWRIALCWRAAWRFLWQKMHAGVAPFVAELKRRGSALFHLDIWQKLDAGYPESPRQWYFDLLISQSMGTFYTGQLLQQNIFTPGTLDNFYTRHLWHQTTFTTNNFYTRHPFTPDIFYTRRLLHQTPLTPGTFYNRQFLQERAQKHKHKNTKTQKHKHANTEKHKHTKTKNTDAQTPKNTNTQTHKKHQNTDTQTQKTHKHTNTTTQLYQHRPQIAWKGITDFLQFVSGQFTRYIFFHRYISGQETNQNTDTKNNQAEIAIYIKIILRTPTRIRIRWHLQWHHLWQPPLPDPYTHQLTASMTPCMTTARSWIWEPAAVHTSDSTSNDTLCDSPVLDLRTLTPTHTPDGTSNNTLRDSPPATNPQNLRTLTPQLEVRTPMAKAIWGNTNTVAPDSFYDKQKTQTQNTNTQAQKSTNKQTHKNTNTQKHKRANTEKHKHANTQKTPKHNHTKTQPHNVIQSATPYYKAIFLYYSVLQSTTLYYKVLLQYRKEGLCTTKDYSSTTLYYKVLLQYYSGLQSTTPVHFCTTKYHAVLQSTIPAFRAAKYYKVLLQHYSVLQSTSPVLVCTT